ncbi:hypothetical protein WFL04_14885, partial [Yersinia enterocolitica]
MSEILTFGLMVGQPALRNLCLAGSPRTLLAMSASRPETFDKLFYGFSKGDFRASSASKYFASSYWV